MPHTLNHTTVYLTDDKREALVVFTGDEQTPIENLAPMRDANGAIRIAYLNADGTEADLLMTEYAFYSGTLTPHHPLPDKA